MAALCWLQARADDIKYNFTPGTRLFYEVVVEADAPNEHRTITGYLSMNVKSVDAVTGDAVIDYDHVPWRAVAQGFNGVDDSEVIIDSHMGRLFKEPFAAKPGQQLKIDPHGAITKTDLSDLLTYLQGPATAAVLQPLPTNGQDKWTAKRSVTIYRRNFPTHVGEPFSRSSYPGNGEASPADEVVDYSVSAKTADTVTIDRKYDLLSQQTIGNTPVEHMHGDGHFVFDRKAGNVSSLEWNLVDDLVSKDGAVSEPIHVTARRLEGADLAKVLTDIAAVDDPVNVNEQKTPPRQSPKQKPPAAAKSDESAMTNNLPDGTVQTEILGTTQGGGPFVAASSRRQPVIGFRIRVASFAGRVCLRTFDPLYEKPTEPAKKNVEILMARDGYAVGALKINAGEFVNAVKITFMKTTATGLDPKQSYDSDWYGRKDGSDVKTLGGDGKFIYGLCGRKGLNVDAMGLVVDSDKNNKVLPALQWV